MRKKCCNNDNNYGCDNDYGRDYDSCGCYGFSPIGRRNRGKSEGIRDIHEGIRDIREGLRDICEGVKDIECGCRFY